MIKSLHVGAVIENLASMGMEKIKGFGGITLLFNKALPEETK